MRLKVAGEAKLGDDGTVSLPDAVLREVGWEHGDTLWIDIVDGGRIVLSRAPNDIVAYFAGALTHLYPDPEDTRRFLDEGRGYGDESDPNTEP
jgi:bifunctional DNA-binding transcriptional regulator/antitoxin component of YhaV-PrlF toxin-antitoxin module